MQDFKIQVTNGNQSYIMTREELYQKLQIRDFKLTQFATEEEITTNSIGILDYIREIIARSNYQSEWPWINMVMKHFSGTEFFNLIISCESIAEVAERIEFDGRMNAEFKQLYANDNRSLSDAMLAEARYLVKFMQILIDEDITFSAAYFHIGTYNNTPFASFELFDDSQQMIDGESYSDFIQRIIDQISSDTEQYKLIEELESI